MFEEWVSTEMMVRKVIDDDKAAANTFFKETALPLARNLETWIPTVFILPACRSAPSRCNPVLLCVLVSAVFSGIIVKLSTYNELCTRLME